MQMYQQGAKWQASDLKGHTLPLNSVRNPGNRMLETTAESSSALACSMPVSSLAMEVEEGEATAAASSAHATSARVVVMHAGPLRDMRTDGAGAVYILHRGRGSLHGTAWQQEAAAGVSTTSESTSSGKALCRCNIRVQAEDPSVPSSGGWIQSQG